MAAIAKEDRKINLVLEIHQIDALRNLNNFLSDEKSKRKALKNLRKFALIADANWIEELGDFIDLFTPNIEVNVFDLDERNEANTWLQTPTQKEDGDLRKGSNKDMPIWYSSIVSPAIIMGDRGGYP